MTPVNFRCDEKGWPDEQSKKAMVDHTKCKGWVWLEMWGKMVNCDCICHKAKRPKR